MTDIRNTISWRRAGESGLATSRIVMTTVQLVGALMLLGALADLGSGVACAQGKLDATYTVTLSGVPIGNGSWTIDVEDGHFSAAASGATTGLLRILANGQGNSVAHGTVSNGQPIASTFASTITADKRSDEVRVWFSGGNLKEFIADPPTVPSPDRVPLTEAHRKGVADPMTASLIRVPGTGSTFVPEACKRTLAIFDGRMRYDLHLAFRRLDNVKAEKGYQGTVVVCSVYFFPLAGHVPDRSVIKYLVAQRDMEIWLAPVAGTRLMVPYRASIPTPIGLGVLQAIQFVSIPQAARSTATILN
jgi:hypothetical protein